MVLSEKSLSQSLTADLASFIDCTVQCSVWVGVGGYAATDSETPMLRNALLEQLQTINQIMTHFL